LASFAAREDRFLGADFFQQADHSKESSTKDTKDTKKK
jgi:hypothetical protein